MAVLVTAIHAFAGARPGAEDVDARDKPAHDERGRATRTPVMAVLVATIHAFTGAQLGVEDVDARDKPAHDERG